MGQSLVKNYVHIVFSTKYRQPFIHSPIDNELYNYLGAVCNEIECQSIKIGGYTDHVHVLCKLSKKIALMKLVEEIKSHSSKWMKTKAEYLSQFYWQNGYAAFSVNPADIDKMNAYISKQKTHHQKEGFQSEFRALMKKYDMSYDEKYIWE